MKTAPLPSTIESTVSNCINPCGHLVLLEYGTSHTGLAFQLAAELLKWPEEVAVKLYYDGSTTLPVIPITNKYFSTRVDITIITDNERINMTSPSTVLEQELLQNSTLTTGCVIIVDGSMRPEDILWDSIPERCLFRILMLFGKDSTITRNEMWYDACVNNGFEYVSHSSGYEIVPEGAETCGLLGGDLFGAARLLQVLHNTLWPESCRLVKCHNSNNTKSDNNNNNNNSNNKSEKENSWKHGSMLENRIALIGIHTRDVLDWFYTSLKDQRFFTMEWPPKKEHPKHQTITFNSHTNSIMLAIANKYYTAMVGVECIHPALFFPAMEDLFMTQYLNKCLQLAILCWPPSSSNTTTSFGTTSIIRKEHIFTDNCDYPPLSVFIERLQRWGVKEYVLLITARGKGVLSPGEEYYCAEKSIEILYINNDEMDMNDIREFGPIGADRLAEIIHTITWPQRHSIPTKTTMKSLSLSSLSVSSELLKEKKNRLLVWAVGTSPAEEELLLQNSLTACLSVSNTPNINQSTLFSLSIPSMQSNSLSIPLKTIRVVNKYFEANVDVHCYGGARRVVLRESDPNIDQLQSFGIVILVTTSAVVEEVKEKKEKEEKLEKSKTIQERLLYALETCCTAENIAHDTCSSLSLLAYDEHEGKDITHELSEAAEKAPVYMWYIVDGDASSDILTTQVDTLLLQSATKTATREETEKEKRKVKQDSLDVLHDKDDNMDKSNNNSISNSSMDDTFFASPFEVLYGVDEEDPIVYLRESIEQHVWPYRNMLKEDTHTEIVTCEINKNEEKEEVVEEDSVYIGCDLPPDYLVDPITCKSEYVAALAVRITGTKPDIVDGQLDDKQEKQQEDLMVWMDKMKNYGHKLHRTVRQRQAELLANKLGECLGALDGL